TEYGKWKRRKGELLRPDADNIEDIERLRKKLVNPSFELLYQQDVDAQSLPPLRSDHFRSFDSREVQTLRKYISIDPGTGADDGQSFSVIQLWATNGRDYFLIDEFRERCDFVDLVKAASKFARRNRGATILVEDTANGPALLSTLTRKQQ